jgi:hypothetical protein
VVVIEAERALGGVVLQDRDRIRRDVAGVGIETAELGIAEIGKIEAAIRIAHHVVGLVGLLTSIRSRPAASTLSLTSFVQS